jgi:hypothetical protein
MCWKVHALIAHLRKKKSYFIVALISILIVSVVLNLYDNSYTIPVEQTRIRYMSAEAFQSWLGEMKSIKSILQIARTNVDVKDAINYTLAANGFANILEWQIEISRPPNFAEHLYLRVSTATYMLDRAVTAVATRPLIFLRNLDDTTIQKIGTLTITIENLASSVVIVTNGVDPVRQLEEQAFLNDLTSYLMQITTTSSEIWEMYGFYG